MKEEDYKRAIEEITFRQNFLDNLDLGWTRSYVKHIKYESELIDKKDRIIMRTIQNVVGKKSEILVYPKAFSDFHPKFADFYSTLVYHEGYHARESFEFGAEDGILGDLNLELRARKFQLEHVNGENSQAFIDNLRREIRIYQDVTERIKEVCRMY